MTESTSAKPSRRGLIAGAAALAPPCPSLGALSTLPNSAEAAQQPMGQQVPSIYRYKVGSIELTAVNDGVRTSPLAENFVKNAKPDEINAALEAGFMPKGQVTTQFNPLLLNTGGKLVLIDTGNGPQAGNATVGRLNANLGWAGVKPADVDIVIISHFHGDHINGLRTDDGVLAFQNAEILVPAPEWAFWMDEGEMSRAPEGMKPAFANVRRVFKDLDSRVRRYEWDKEIAPGITSVAAPGHTPATPPSPSLRARTSCSCSPTSPTRRCCSSRIRTGRCSTTWTAPRPPRPAARSTTCWQLSACS